MKRGLVIPALFLVIFSIPTVYSQQEEPYVGPEYCKQCHPAVYEIWKTSPHSTAYSVLKEWNETHGGFAPSFCLDCHTTSLKYNVPDVTCEICHGAKDTEVIDSRSRFCGRCHIEHQEAFATGAHAKKLICTQCHDAHLTKILADTPTMLCGSCHTQTYNSYLDGTHHSNEVACIDCHMKRTEGGEEHTPELDHRFYSVTEVCFDCHNPHTVRSLIDLDKDYSASLLALQEDVADLRYIDYAKNILVVILLSIMVILVVLLSISRRRR